MRQYDYWKYLEYRAMQEDDLESVLAIERDIYSFPWSEKIFRDCIQSPYDCRLLLMYQEVVGYFIVSKVLDEAHLLNICLQRKSQGLGLAKTALQQLLDELVTEKFKRIYLEVRPSNRRAIALYNGLGFDVIGERKAYYPAENGREDAITMACSLG